MKVNIDMKHNKQQNGFTLIEIMVAMVIGIVMTLGIFQIYFNSKDSQDIVLDRTELVDDSRFVVEMMAYDLRRAGLWGKTNNGNDLYNGSTIKGKAIDDVKAALAGANDCVISNLIGNKGYSGKDLGWAMDILRPVFGVDEAFIDANGFPYSNCITGQYFDGDALEVRYAGEAIPVSNLDSNTVYIVSQGQHSEVFFGGAPAQPGNAIEEGLGVGGLTDPPVTYHKYEAVLYYVSSFTDGDASSNDGIPSLRRVSLQTGPAMVDEVLLSGVEDLQLQFGVDLNIDSNPATVSIQQYKDANNIKTGAQEEWGAIKAAQTWVITRSKLSKTDNTAQTFVMPTKSVTTSAGDYKRLMVSNTVSLRNIAYANQK